MIWEMVIGLETHIELSTKTKIFCGCTTQFGGEPNTHCCPVCTGQPGSLPVLNKKVVEYAITAGLALNCRVNRVSKMARKHYVYPDLPKAYQTSQFDMPLCVDGWVTLKNGRRIGIERIHIEEDAGKLIHQGGKEFIDYNRGGVPLIEIVTRPDFRSPEEVVEYMEKLQGIMRAVGVSDCRMQEGSMRCDVNISLRPKGEERFGIRTEVKNLNSMTAVSAAIAYEYERQKDILEDGGTVVQETLHFNSDTGETANMRDKENADDYRYFTEPDILPIVVDEAMLQTLQEVLPELPDARLRRYVETLHIPEADATLIVKYRKVAEYFENAAKGLKQPQTVASLMITQMYRVITTEAEREQWSPGITAEQVRELALLLEQGKITRNIAKNVFAKMLEQGKPAMEFLSKEDLQGFSQEELKAVCKQVVEQNPKAVEDYLGGKEKAVKALIGQVMKATKGRADASLAERELISQIKDV